MTALAIPLDGRLTSQNVLDIPLSGGEVMEIVSPGNAALGNTYQVTTFVLGTYFSSFAAANTIIVTSGATLATPYNVPTTATRILFNKSAASATYAVLPASATMFSTVGVFFKDLKGDASTHPITISFSGGELCDGLSTVVIANDYGWTTINPIPNSNGWYQS